MVVNNIILRIVQRMLLYSLGIKGLTAHEITRGCLFDLTPSLTDLQFSVDNTFLCEECKPVIAEARGPDFLKVTARWIRGRQQKAATAA